MKIILKIDSHLCTNDSGPEADVRHMYTCVHMYICLTTDTTQVEDLKDHEIPGRLSAIAFQFISKDMCSVLDSGNYLRYAHYHLHNHDFVKCSRLGAEGIVPREK